MIRVFACIILYLGHLKVWMLQTYISLINFYVRFILFYFEKMYILFYYCIFLVYLLCGYQKNLKMLFLKLMIFFK